MKIFNFLLLLFCISLLTSCASGYDMIHPEKLTYASSSVENDIQLDYKYDLLERKYKKKEVKKGVQLIAIKITNNTDRDLVFGRDVRLAYENGYELQILETENVFKTLKQSPASYLFYLLLTPVNFFSTKTNANGSQTTNTFPIGYVLAPGLAGGNMLAAGSANKKFKKELLAYSINGSILKKGEATYGLIGIEASSYDSIKVKTTW